MTLVDLNSSNKVTNQQSVNIHVLNTYCMVCMHRSWDNNRQNKMEPGIKSITHAGGQLVVNGEIYRKKDLSREEPTWSRPGAVRGPDHV